MSSSDEHGVGAFEETAVPGIDGIIVGPYDLSASMGYPGEYDRDDVKEALQIIS